MDVRYSDFMTGDNAADTAAALAYCRQKGAARLSYDRGEYHFTSDCAAERTLCISNHGYNGLKRIAFLLEDMRDFTLDGGGSTFVIDSLMLPFALLRSKNIRLLNFTLIVTDTYNPEGTVAAAGDGVSAPGDVCDIRIDYSSGLYLLGKTLCTDVDGMVNRLFMNVEFDPATGEIAGGTADNTLGIGWEETEKELLPGNILRVHGVKRRPEPGAVIVWLGCMRRSAGIFVCGCSDVVIDSAELRSCIGMGLIAQASENITVTRMRVTPPEGRHYSLNGDAVHFVACSGLIRVEDCLFENQLDDALNVHGIYTKIIRSDGACTLTKFMHAESSGIELFGQGDRVAFLDPKSLLPKSFSSVREAVPLNTSVIRLVFEDGAVPLPGDLIENLTRSPDVLFRRCTVRNNRARGMLLAARGKIRIEDCLFHTAGAAALFEADGEYWYESGGTTDAVFTGNVFDRCRHGLWGSAVLEVVPRRASEEGRYYHKRITAENNEFRGSTVPPLLADNVETVVFRRNRFTDGACGKAVYVRCGTVTED